MKLISQTGKNFEIIKLAVSKKAHTQQFLGIMLMTCANISDDPNKLNTAVAAVYKLAKFVHDFSF